MPDDRLRYALSESDSNLVFHARIQPKYLPRDLSVVPSPVAVLLGGQPGAGKSKLLDEATTELSAKGSTVTINGDDLRLFHPRYTELRDTDPLNAARYTDADSGRWVEKLIEAASDRKVNLVIEGTMRRPEVVERTATSLRERGYTVEARTMAVSPEVSWLGVHQRFERALACGEAPRFSAREAHDGAVTGMVGTLREAEAGQLVDRIMITNRAGARLYERELRNGAPSVGELTAADIVRAEHRRGFSQIELAAFEVGWKSVLTQMRGRAAPAVDQQQVAQDAAAGLAAIRARGAEVGLNPQPSLGTGHAAREAFATLSPEGKLLVAAMSDRINRRMEGLTANQKADLKAGFVGDLARRERAEGPVQFTPEMQRALAVPASEPTRPVPSDSRHSVGPRAEEPGPSPLPRRR